jgi:hypothetical protein
VFCVDSFVHQRNNLGQPFFEVWQIQQQQLKSPVVLAALVETDGLIEPLTIAESLPTEWAEAVFSVLI